MPSVINSRYGFTTYGYRTALEEGVIYDTTNFFLFLDGIGITSTHRAFWDNPNFYISLRFPEVDTDLLSFGAVTGQQITPTSRLIILNSSYPIFANFFSHTAQTYALTNDRGSIGVGGQSIPPNYFYAVGDNKGIATFAITGNSNSYVFQYFGYCDDPASIATYGNTNFYPLDYVSGYCDQNNTATFKRQKRIKTITADWGGEQGVTVKTSINCATVTPGANTSDVIFLDNGDTDYGTDYPLGKARPFLLYTSDNSLPVNSLTKVDSKTTGNEFYLIVATVTGGGRLMMPIITENTIISA